MYSLHLSPWTTVRGPASTTPIKQPETQWLDTSDFQDLVGWLEVKEYSPTSGATLTFAYQLSPTKDDALFVSNASTSVTIGGTGVTVTKLLSGNANVYTARWLRYQLSISSAVAWDITLRCWVSANPGARRRHESPRCSCGRLLDLSRGRCGCGCLLRRAP